jgi:dipeptidase D
MSNLSDLQPQAVWRHFFKLCRIPRASKREGALRIALVAWAQARGLGVRADVHGNLVLSKPASKGYEHRPGVVLQGHLDMVCQKNGGSAHDFDTDPIEPVLRDGWVTASGTTLGADNGIGVALALAALEADDLAHPPLEVLLTAGEECGMHGALALGPDVVDGRLLINLDTEEWGELYIGCAGSVDVIIDAPLPTETIPVIPADRQAVTLRLAGLAGGHSGIDIHRRRGNAIKLLARFLHERLRTGADFRLVSMAGGSAHNAIPREAGATLWVKDATALQADAERFVAELRKELNDEDHGVRLDFSLRQQDVSRTVLNAAASQKALAALHELPFGVRAMSGQMPGVVETSNNIGELRLENGRLHINAMVRSLNDSGVAGLTGEIARTLDAVGIGPVSVAGAGPGWLPNPDSRLLALAQSVYQRTFGSEAKVQVIHAGLECGVFSTLWPEMDLLSFGPTIHGAHAPGERVDAASVERTWRLLVEILAAIPEE